MTLNKYNTKRNFSSTSEPEGMQSKSENELIFVVQEHAASRLHYDFRLELDGTLKSWAVPKGPSMNPNDKRLAVMVEDHPYTYKDFEGVIPEGNYGAGTVIIWDTGVYEAVESKDQEDWKKKLSAGLHKGHISFILKGKKLKGEFSLVKIKGDEKNAWLLIKKNDKYATEVDILKKNKSVVSSLTIKDLEKKLSKPPAEKEKKKSGGEPVRKKVEAEFMKPMLAQSTENPFDDKDWVFEIKYDGYRTIAVINPGRTELFSRNHISATGKFKSIADELKKINHLAVLDGEVIIENKEGRSDFQLLQNYHKTRKGTLKYYVFDLLNLNGTDTRSLPLLDRKELLKILLDKNLNNIYYSDHFPEKGKTFYNEAIRNNLEGIIAKNKNSGYLSGKRTSDWLKIKISKNEEAIIIGITEPKGSRKYFGAVLLAQYLEKELIYIGNCGTGFKEDTLKELYVKFKPSFIENSPLKEKIKYRGQVQWIKPRFVCQVKFTEWTQEGHLRHPVFLGLRFDEDADEVTNESAENNLLPDKKEKEKKIKTPVKKKDISPPEDDYTMKIGKINLKLTNQNKIYFPDDNITKGDVVNYYKEIAEIMLPYLADRPQSMNRFPNGINGISFYQKDVDVEKVPSWLKTTKVFSESNKEYINYLLCNDKATLVYMANLGCIEINPWNSTVNNPENPDWVVIDLDPGKIDFKEVVKAALVVKQVMDEFDTECYCKTSGATGLHVYIPLEAKYSYDTVKIFAELIASRVNARLPGTTSIKRPVKKRQNKIYVDFLQNRRGQTLAAPYSVRPKPGATVSTPLEWKEVNSKLLPSKFTISNTFKRIERKGDLWKPVIGKGADLEKILHQISDET